MKVQPSTPRNRGVWLAIVVLIVTLGAAALAPLGVWTPPAFSPVTNSLASTTPSTVQSGPVTLTSHPMGGTAPYTYQWYSSMTGTGACSSGTPITGATDSTYHAAPTSRTYYCYTVTDSASTPMSQDSGWTPVEGVTPPAPALP
ncbi:MAG: hypothetical protein L3J97_03535, partial [Thermoplasmata archaeon]|nr:hypothetical protein [Thermoplasmata archaeon]